MKLIHYLLILVAILTVSTGISTYRLIQESDRADALEAAVNIYEEDFKALEKETRLQIDSIAQVKAEREKTIDLRDKQIEEILANIENLLNTTPNEAAIDNIRDADSLTHLFARYYPDKSGAGKGSD